MTYTVQDLVDAAACKRTDDMERALKDGVDINGAGSDGRTALQTAATEGNLSATWLLLRHGADPNAVGTDPRSAAVLSMIKGHVRVLQSLVDVGAVLDRRPGELDKMLLQGAAVADAFQSQQAVKLLLAHGASPHIQDEYQRTPLHYAAIANNASVCLTLVKGGAEVDVEGRRGARPLTLAIMNRCRDAARALVALGAKTWGLVSADEAIDNILDHSRLRCAVDSHNQELLLYVMEQTDPTPKEFQGAMKRAKATKQSGMEQMLRSWNAQHQARCAVAQAGLESMLGPRP